MIDANSYNNYQGAPPGPTMQQPVHLGTPIFIPSEYPVRCICSSCGHTIVTRLEKQNGLLTWLIVGTLVLLGCWLGCCLIPFCVDGCKVRHTNP